MSVIALLLETSGPCCSVAVADLAQGPTGQVIAEADSPTPMRHTEMLLSLVREAFAKTAFVLQDTAVVAVSTGPGSYTALRAGYSSAKGFCLSLNVPLIEVSTLQALASLKHETTASPTEVYAMVPARRDEVYFAHYAADLKELRAPAPQTLSKSLVTPADPNMSVRVVATDLALISPLLPPTVSATVAALNARNLLSLTLVAHANQRYSPLDSAAPLYVKPPFITQAKPRL